MLVKSLVQFLERLSRIDKSLEPSALDELLFVALPAATVNEIVVQGPVFVRMVQVQSAGFDPVLNVQEKQSLVDGNAELAILTDDCPFLGSKKPVGTDLSTAPSFSLKCSMASANFRTPGSPWKVSALRIGLTRF